MNVEMPLTDKTPLHLAVSHGLVHATERWLDHGADSHRKTREGKTAYEIVAERKKQRGCGDGCENCSEVETLLQKE